MTITKQKVVLILGCIHCIAPNCVENKRITTKAELNGIFGLKKEEKIFMGLSVEEVRNKLDFYCGNWTVMAFNAFMADLSRYKYRYTLEWPYNNKSLIITICDVRTLWTYIIPIHTSGCTTEKEILRARDAWKEFILNMEYEKPVEKHCINCRYFKLSPSAEPCRDCHACDGNFNNWEPKEEKGMEKKCCENCRYSEESLHEEPCKSCLGDVDGCYTYWEPKENKEMEDVFNYAKRDVEVLRESWQKYFTINPSSNKPAVPKMPGIEDVIFNGPATIVKWMDGTKTVVKAQKGKNGKTEKLDPEKGLAMAICKKVYGNDGRYYDIFKRYCK